MSGPFQILCEALPLATAVMVVALHFSRSRQLPATRGHQLLMAACLLSLLSPLLVGLMPKWQVLPAVRTPFVIGLPTGAQASAPAYPLWFRAIGWLWVAGLLTVLVHLGRQLAHYRALWQESTPVSREIEALLGHLAARRGITRPLHIRFHSNLESACTWGVRRPVILISHGEARLPLSELRMVLDHELAHIQRLDAASGWLLQAFAACYWFHPCARLLIHRADLFKERACDDLVLLSGQRPAAYAACLGSAALRTTPAHRLPSAACTFAHRHPLLARLDAILDSRQARSQPSPEETFRAITPITIFAILLSSLGFKVASEVQPQSPAWIASVPGQPVPSLWSDLIQPAAGAVASVVGIPVPEPSQQTASASSRKLSAPQLPPTRAVALPSSDGSRPSLNAGLGGSPRATNSRFASAAPAFSAAKNQRFHSAPSTQSRGGSHYSAGISSPSLPPASAVAPAMGSDSAIGESVPPSDSRIIPVSDRADAASELVIAPAVKAIRGSIAAVAIQVVDDEGIAFVVEAVPLTPDGEPTAIASPSVVSTGIGADYLGSTDAGVPPDDSGWLGTPELVGIQSEVGEHFAVSVEVPARDAAAWSAEASTDAQTWTNSQAILAQWIAPSTSTGTVRIQAAVIEPVHSSSYRYLRLKANW